MVVGCTVTIVLLQCTMFITRVEILGVLSVTKKDLELCRETVKLQTVL